MSKRQTLEPAPLTLDECEAALDDLVGAANCASALLRYIGDGGADVGHTIRHAANWMEDKLASAATLVEALAGDGKPAWGVFDNLERAQEPLARARAIFQARFPEAAERD